MRLSGPPVDNKRKGSASPSGGFKWDESPRDPFAFADDDDGPLPAPPDFDSGGMSGRGGGVPELLDAEEIVEAEVVEDPELLDSALVTELRPTHAMPPPIPAPVPTGPGPRAFLDDGEIALPPRISRIAPQSFPFRHVRAEPDPSAEELLDDETLDASSFRSAALNADEDSEPEEPEELDPDELESAEEPEPAEAAEAEPPPRRMPTPPPAEPPSARSDPALRFTDDDDDDRPPPAPPADDPSLRFADDDDDDQRFTAGEQAPPQFAGDAPATPERFADDEPSLTATPDDDDATQQQRWQPRDRAPSPAQMFADDERDADDRSADTVADGSIAGVNDDETGLFPDVRQNSPTGLFARDTLRSAARRGSPPAPATATATATSASGFPADDDEPTSMFAIDRLRDAAAATGQQPQHRDDHDEDGLLPRAPQPSSAIPVAPFDDDDDDATWAAATSIAPSSSVPSSRGGPSSAPATPVVTAAPPSTPAASSSSSMNARVGPSSAPAMASPPTIKPTPMTAPPAMVAPPPVIASTDDAEGSGIGGWIATRPGASMASGAIAVADFADDDDDWPAPKHAAPAAVDASAPVDDDDAQTIEAPASADADADADADDDEWEPHAAAVHLAPAPTDLGEPFPLDLWSDPDELIGRELGQYRLERPLSRGMTTRVYLGVDNDSGREVAVRILGPMHSPAEPRARQFLHEAQQLIKLRGEHVVEVLATGTTHDHLSYYVMEKLAGETLASTLRSQGPLPWADVAAFANQICDALILAADRLFAWNKAVISLVKRRPHQVVHRGVENKKLFMAAFLDVAHAGQKNPGVSDERASGFQNDMHAHVFEDIADDECIEV